MAQLWFNYDAQRTFWQNPQVLAIVQPEFLQIWKTEQQFPEHVHLRMQKTRQHVVVL